MMYLCQFSQNLSIGSEDRMQKRLFRRVNWPWWPWKLGQDTKTSSSNDVSVPVLSKSSHWFRRLVQTRLFTVVWPRWHGSLGQGHQNLIISYSFPNDVSMVVWPKSGHFFQKKMAQTRLFHSDTSHDLEI